MQEYMNAAVQQHDREAEQLSRAAEARRLATRGSGASQDTSFLRRLLSFGTGSHTASAH